MASRSLFLSLNRKFRNRGFLNQSFKAIPVFNEASVSNYCSHGALRSESLDESVNSEEINDLKSRIFRLRLPKRSAINVIQRWTSEGNQVTITELRNISKELRRLQRYKHALEILEWMVSHNKNELSDSDFAIRIDLMTKVFGIDAAERYFEGLPIDAKTCETYTALLHSFAGSKLTEKAETLYEKMKESGIPLTALPFNEMMTLYTSVGQVEKVSSIVDDLKQSKVHPDIFTYNLWISSLAATLNINGVIRILDEMNRNPNSNEVWVRYINLVNIYITSAHLLHSESNSVVESESGITQREWITYDLLIILYAGMGNKDKVDEIWRSLRMTKQKMTSRNYICILSCYLMLDHLKEIGEVIDQWKQSSSGDFDVSACNRLVNAFVEAGLKEKGNSFVTILKNCEPTEA
ncbi:pentatricopeptide repeat-containing protein At5g09450, mitochondrial isoform X1 [Cucurbita pepo subsp. pepo]|uniref:pentatricopeptide repeat-containing protein At5g09450, mitochondrial isoform X1 n=1 Tax=Cucurbita pepo subsp. pepo TaxID=3664 RepID=UPI000C9D7A26|nr:pentatricopeptide repeat-containing protein At5g09450, mitochondrial isoform X1 [Cucurbita pepo subsp. pepo]